jgi:hypothetical protein
MTVCICPDAGKDGHVLNCPYGQSLRPPPRDLPEVSSGEKWGYKFRVYEVIKVRPDIRIQFNDNWDTAIFYRLASPDNAEEAAMKFVRSQTDFLAKFHKQRIQ